MGVKSKWIKLTQKVSHFFYNFQKNNVTVLHEMTYDSQGNPLTISNFRYEDALYDHAELSWDGRELHEIIVKDASDNTVATITYAYNDQGYRVSKTIQEGVVSNVIQYALLDDKVLYETNGSYGILYSYDQDGTIIGFNLDNNVNDGMVGNDYFYVRNQQNDVIAIVNALGLEVVRYHYDAYGVLIDHSCVAGYENVFLLNPYTYRGYRYDQEIGMYYLNSRYYNPEIGRFLNDDGMLGQSGDILSTNMYAYCVNNPVMYTDREGKFAIADDLVYVIVAVALVVTSFLVLAVANELGVPGADDLLDKIKDIFTKVGNSISLAKNKIKSIIESLIIAVSSTLERKEKTGTYIIQFASGHYYVGKEGIARATVSALFQSLAHNDVPTGFFYQPASSDREAFINEYIYMVEFGFHKNDTLYNLIWSPGRNFYYEDFGAYYLGDPGQ